MRAVATAVVPAPPDKVWDVLADHEGMSSWGPSRGPGVTVTISQPGTGERNGVGAVRRIATPGPGPDLVEEVTRFDPGKALGYRAVSGVPFKGYRGEVRLAPVGPEHGGGTRIEWEISAEQRIPLLEQGAIKAVATVLLRLLVRAVGK